MKICSNKECKHAGQYQPLENFPADKSRAEGVSHTCLECNRARCREWYKKNADRKRAYLEEYRGKYGRKELPLDLRKSRQKALVEQIAIEKTTEYHMIKFTEPEWEFAKQRGLELNLSPGNFIRYLLKNERSHHERN